MSRLTVRNRINRCQFDKVRFINYDSEIGFRRNRRRFFSSFIYIRKPLIIIHPASIRLLTDATWDFARDTLWKRFPFYESEIEAYKNCIRKYYENVPAESFKETVDVHFLFYCIKIMASKSI